MESQPQNTVFRNNPENFHPYRPDGGASQVGSFVWFAALCPSHQLWSCWVGHLFSWASLTYKC